MFYSIARGVLSFTPIKFILKKKGTGGSSSARYCYSVWLRHLILLNKNGLREHPKVVAELGPGDSLGVGLAALITGAEKYYAFDVIKHTDLKNNIKILEELLELFEKKSDIPDESEFPDLKPSLEEYKYPEYLLKLNMIAIQKKVEQILDNLNGKSNNIIKYIVPWFNYENITENQVDLIFSQAVMEHILDLESAYKIMYNWLVKGGYISHQIDFRAHETHKVWNGHWKYSDFLWKIIMHGRAYPINRQPFSAHVRSIKNAGFNIKSIIPIHSFDGYDKKTFRGYFSEFNEEDYITSSAHIIAEK